MNLENTHGVHRRYEFFCVEYEIMFSVPFYFFSCSINEINNKVIIDTFHCLKKVLGFLLYFQNQVG